MVVTDLHNIHMPETLQHNADETEVSIAFWFPLVCSSLDIRVKADKSILKLCSF
jgi:hypothetical protein